MAEPEIDVSRTPVRNLNNVAELSLDDGANLYESEYQPPEGADEGDLASGPMNETVRIDKNDRSLSEFRRWHDDGRLGSV